MRPSPINLPLVYPQSPEESLPPSEMASDASRCRHVAAVPYPGRGHVNPMLNLCRSLLAAAPDLSISLVVTEEWAGLIAAPGGGPPPPAGVRIVAAPNCIPSEAGRARDFAGFLDAVYTEMGPPFEAAIAALEPPVEGIIADTYLPWAVEVGIRRGVPVYSLFPMSATFFSALYHLDRLEAAREGRVSGGAGEEADEPLAKHLPGHRETRISDLSSVLTSHTPRKRAMEAFAMVRKAQAVLFTSCYELEAQIIDALRDELPCPVYPIGPSIPYMLLLNDNSSSDHIGWLDSQPNQSVLYVSLGSFLSVSATQMEELAMGLRLSGVRFLWVARSDSSRLQEIIGDRGIVVPWCDQLKVLSHSSVGCFLTHCGWNSTLEGAFCGVPMLTFPIFWDQPVDSRLIVDEWRVGLRLGGEVGREGVVGREEIAVVVKRLMELDGGESKEMRRRAAEVKESARRAVGAGGSSLKNIDSFVSDLGDRC